MPLYMDRHDLPDVTAEDVAEAHAKDLEVGPKHDVSFLTYWFDPDLDAAFCLARAPDAEHVAASHAEAHGLIPNQIIDASEDSVLRFLGRVQDPVDPAEVASAFRTILFTDLADSTALAQELEPSAYMELLKAHDGIVRRALLAARGREVKHTGDGIMASFETVSDALDCALVIQEGLEEEPRFGVRVGMAAGEPVDHNDDLFGATVNLASRISGLAEPGEILVSDTVRELGEAAYVFEGGENVSLKGFAEAVPVFRLVGKQPAEL